MIMSTMTYDMAQLLRKQLMYNTLLESCLGRSVAGLPSGYQGSEYMFQLLPSPPDNIRATMDAQDGHTEQCVIGTAACLLYCSTDLM